ncbi:hypothetical protein [Persicobacter diffluens]|uniref:Uncharacterized protein n=1 Tax=Persicobacter diffluens TaxID=981 RepID=A0AAN4W1N3_9BACT|nr:hypothetical protein PEDI_36280 [Persicobacter diffluens]
MKYLILFLLFVTCTRITVAQAVIKNGKYAVEVTIHDETHGEVITCIHDISYRLAKFANGSTTIKGVYNSPPRINYKYEEVRDKTDCGGTVTVLNKTDYYLLEATTAETVELNLQSLSHEGGTMTSRVYIKYFCELISEDQPSPITD